MDQDAYSTPAWCVDALLEEVRLPGGTWLEPCAGDGAIIRAVSARRSDVRWQAVELRSADHHDLRAVPWHTGDFLRWRRRAGFNVVLTNPPYSLAMPFIERAIQLAPLVAMLLRLNFSASGERAVFMRETRPSVYVLPNRPQFVASIKCSAKACGWRVMQPLDQEWPRRCPTCAIKTSRTTSDASEYAWFLWEPTRAGLHRVLAPRGGR